MAALGTLSAMTTGSAVTGTFGTSSYNASLLPRTPQTSFFYSSTRVLGGASRWCTSREHIANYVKPRVPRRMSTCASATAEEVAVEEPVSEAIEKSESADEANANGTLEVAESSEAAPKRKIFTKRGQFAQRKVTVKLEDLTLGQELTGKVKTIQTYGVFVDIGSSTDGLVHISELTSGFVKDISGIVSVGDEVKVRVKEIDVEKRRIGLSMRDRSLEEETSKDGAGASDSLRKQARSTTSGGERREAWSAGDAASRDGSIKRGSKVAVARSRQDSRKREDRPPTHNFKKGQLVKGKVTKIGQVGASVQLQEGVSAMLYKESIIMEEDKDGGLVPTIKVDDVIEVRIKKLERNNRIVVVMKDEEEDEKPKADLSIGADSSKFMNPFERAFRQAKLVKDRPQAAVAAKEESTEEADIVVIDPTSAEEDEAVPEPEVAASLESPEVPAPPEPEAEPEAAVLEAAQSVEAPQAAEPEPAAPPEVAVPEASQAVEVPPAAEQVPEAEPEPAPAAPSDPEPAAAVEEAAQPVEAPAPAAMATSDVGATLAPAQPVEAPAPAAVATSEAAATGTPAQAVEVPAPAAVATSEAAATVAPAQPVEVPAPAAVATSEAAATGAISAALVKQLREETGAGMMDCKKALKECEGDVEKARDFLRKKGLASAEKKAGRIAAEGLVSSYVHDNRIGVLLEVNCETDFVARGDKFKELVADLAMQVAACPQVEYVETSEVNPEYVAKEREIEMGKEDLLSKPEAVRGKIVTGRIEKRLAELALMEQPYIRDDKVLVKDLVKSTVAALGENIKVRRFVRFNLGEGLAKKEVDFAAEVAAQTKAMEAAVVPKEEAAPAPAEPAPAAEVPKVAVSPALVKELREATGAGMMDCKKALAQNDNDIAKATEFLRKKGLASAEKKSGRIAAEGIIGSYIHDNRIGVLIEVNCETDFVARGEKFRVLVQDLAMQVAACPQVEYVTTADVPEDVVAKEREIEMGKEDLLSKPENRRAMIVDGRISKRLKELALLEQPYIRETSIDVQTLVKQTIAELGENIQVRRFARFNLGEGIEKKKQDFAAEVAAQTGGRV